MEIIINLHQFIKKQMAFSCIIFLCLLFSSQSFANQKLQQLQTQIQSVKSSLTQDQNQYSQWLQTLQKTEMSMGDVAMQLQHTRQQLTHQNKNLKKLKQQQLQYQTQITVQQNALAEQIRTMYLLGHQSYLKILLNQQDPMQLERMLTYYHYINQQRLTMIHQYSQTLALLQQTTQAINMHTQQLTALKTNQQKQHLSLIKNTAQRKQLLHSLNTQMRNKQQQLQVLLANKQALEQTLLHLQKNHHYALGHYTPPSGKLPWPITGKIIEHFGTQILQSQLESTGVVLQASAGQAVHAVMSGEVVFANWMAGYGLLLIIDDGNGYMTIYGRNQTLYKKVGDRVRAGDTIATVGNSGGHNISALFFAIRQNGKPVNPEFLLAPLQI